jgi:methionine sulfoxide reductase heme-binding subunit
VLRGEPHPRAQGWLGRNWHRLLAHALPLAPLLLLLARWIGDDLPINLNRYLMLRSGMIGLVLLGAALACTPLSALAGWRGATQIRRPLGLYAFAYLCAHLAVYAVAENELDLELMLRDLGERWSMSVGLLALLLLAPLALTSTRGWQRRLGPRWKSLHRLIYLAAPLGVLHYYWLDRDIKTAPLIAAAVAGALLLLRIPALRRAVARARSRGRAEAAG